MSSSLSHSITSGAAPPRSPDNIVDDLSFQYFRNCQEGEMRNHPKGAYDPTQESLPDHPFLQVDLKSIDDAIVSMYQDPCDILRLVPKNAQCAELTQSCQDHIDDYKTTAKVFALIGQTGIGKSTIINALLSSPAGSSIAQTDPGSKACTSTAVHYKYIEISDNEGKAFKTCVNFLSKDELRSMLEMLKKEYLAVHGSGAVGDEGGENANSDQDTDAVMAVHAKKVFKMIWGTALDDGNLTATIREINFVEQSFEYAQNRIQEYRTRFDFRSKRSVRENRDDNARALMKRNKMFWSGASDAEPIWSLLHDVEIYLESPLLKHGIILVDCPGYNDSNRHRVDITDRVRREADAELIVTLPGRSEDDNILRVLVRNSVHAHGADNTIIILTQCSEVDPKEVMGHDSDVEDSDGDTDDADPNEVEAHDFDGDTEDVRLTFMRGCYIWVTNQLSDCEDSEGDLQNTYEDYKNHLKRAARTHYALKSARNLQETASTYFVAHEEAPLLLAVIATSPKAYNSWLKSRRSAKDPPDVDVYQTHIPELINLLLLKAARANQKVIEEKIERSARMHNRIEKLVEGCNLRERRVVANRDKLEHFVIICNGVAESIKDHVKRHYLPKMKDKILPMEGIGREWERDILLASEELTEGVHCRTIAKMARCKGCLPLMELTRPSLRGRDTNWNERYAKIFKKEWVLMEAKLEEIDPSAVRGWVEGVLDHFDGAIPTLFEQDAQHKADLGWAKAKSDVLRLVDQFVNTVVPEQIKTLQSYVKASGDNSMMAKALAPAYSETAKESTGKNALQRQKTTLKSELTRPDGPNGQPWMVGAVEQGSSDGLEQVVLGLLEKFQPDIKNTLTDYGKNLENMGGLSSTDAELPVAVDQLLTLLPKLRQVHADLKNLCSGEAEISEDMELD